jgi:hypothetical protein
MQQTITVEEAKAWVDSSAALSAAGDTIYVLLKTGLKDHGIYGLRKSSVPPLHSKVLALDLIAQPQHLYHEQPQMIAYEEDLYSSDQYSDIEIYFDNSILVTIGDMRNFF